MPQHEEAGSRPAIEKSAECAEAEQERLFHWYGATLNARYWLGLANVDSTEAAQLLSGENPDETSETWLEATTWADHAGGAPLMAPQDRRQLLRGFQDVGGKRRLVDWLHLAQTRFWRYDPWIDRYLEAEKNRVERLQQSIMRATRDLTEGETAAADAVDRLHAVRAEIEEWKGKATPTATDFKNQQDALEQLEAEERMLDAAVKNLRGDFAVVNDVSLLRRVVDAAEGRSKARGRNEAKPAGQEKHPPLSPEVLQAIIDGAEPADNPGDPSMRDEQSGAQPARTHTTKTARPRALHAAVKKAMRECDDQTDATEVWNVLHRHCVDELPPFSGISADGHLEYTENNKKKKLRRGNFRRLLQGVLGREAR
ncbi:hypothetical protein A3K87_04290 [Variovorax paradoxus]|uniref:Uncharacterized protein n=1 Tax=Variovorax paradoxus TaxID=34073 RepID=A0AA91DGN8_VARPD|nr:hypothetical protein [Variovorax paradoxus]OAK55025.1 hypothetical protein A3K87_04290 [Variovorax paradoxus]